MSISSPAGMTRPVRTLMIAAALILSAALGCSNGRAGPPGVKLDSGAGGLFISAVEMAQVMAALENGKLLSDKTRLMMKQHDLGIFQVDNTAYYTHNGGFSDGKGRGSSTRLVLCPNNIQVAIVINSSNNDTDSTFTIVKNAIDNSVSKK